MDNVTHAAIGAGVYATYVAASADPVSGTAAGCVFAAAIIGSELPDFDIVFRFFGGPVQYLYQHRQISHSIPFWFLYAFLTGTVMNLIVSGHFWLYTLIAFIGVLTHIGTDILTTYGTLAFWPLSSKKWRLDILFVIEPMYDVLCALGIVLLATGAPFRATVFSMVGIATAYTVWRAVLHRLLCNRLRRRIEREHYARIPENNPFRWRVTPTLFAYPHGHKYVVTDDRTFWFGSFSWRMEPLREAEVKSAEDGAVQFAIHHTYVGQSIRWFASMLFVQTEREGDTTIVHLADAGVRYFDTLSFSAVILVRKQADGTYTMVHEGLRAQSIHVRKSIKEVVSNVGQRMRLTIPSPRK